MKILRPLLVPLALLAAAPAFGAEQALLPFEAGAPAATHPSLYSFTDVYRLTVTGEPFGEFRFVEPAPQVRVVSESSNLDIRFAVSAPHDGGQRWALALAGLFACAWVAHRRLASPY